MSKPFFYRLNAADFFSEVRELSDKECAKWLRTFASDLVAGNSKSEFTISLIEEAKKYKENKSLAGKKGMENRYQKSNSVTPVLEQKTNEAITNSSTRSSSSSSISISTESKEEHKPKIKRFVPPSVPEVEAYMKEIGWNGDAQNFVDHYEARGWIPKGYTQQMKSWKAAVRTWRGNDNGNRNAKRPDTASLDAAYDEFKRAANADKARILGG